MSRAFLLTAAILIVLMVSGSPAKAAPVRFTEVIQIINGLQHPAELRLRGNTYSESAPLAGVYDPMQSGANGAASGSTPKGDALLLTSVTADAPDIQSGVVAVTQGEVDGTVCDCGEIWVPGGFPRWPLLLLAGIPLIFIDGDDEIPPLRPPSTPEEPRSEPTPTPPPVPEPGTLLLFGTGLVAFGASLRRRYVNSKLAAQSQTTEEG
ncbi:MAG TPA: PEP-CTERM sorting domain-containing protein [Pyrinomonadaceae bacterium]|nr:PEP-CTERM sorting domain-containing protein [Pyrinomonadaceae bacterium]